MEINFCDFQRTYLAYHITVKDLENFIETKFAETLHRVTNESGCPAFGQTSSSIFLQGDFKTIHNVFVLSWVYL